MAVTDEAIEKIKSMILSGQLKPGERLPKEPVLAAELGLSRNSLREAVKALSLLNVLVVRQGDGTYVSSLAAPDLLETLTFLVDLHQDESLLELFQVRSVLESAAAGLAAQQVTDDQLTGLADLLDGLSADSTVEELVANDLEFHRRIAEAAGNTVLASMLDSLSQRTARARVWRGLTQEGAVERTMAEHRAILDSIAARDVTAAQARATAHIAGVTDWLRRAAG
ncbi:GntR family transcriptional regulator [Streptomyces tateyamensis]|uniref:GntR family transcriptional regulator n=1 Tax=Streptomyces tateyamensis TaxID=565073 RepID=A0A2V4N9M4_9ACTN|nr:FadR/GntR family transcriptional regulator [Streptomyces tateyamensis]PYC70623.1 GntR family transcriptional regulator [Streptomyces tateyamensis]